MTTDRFTSESGVDYEINCADFGCALEMKNAVLKCIQNSNIEKDQIDSVVLLCQQLLTKDKKEITITDILKILKLKGMHAESLINGIKNTFIELDTSSDTYQILWKCLSRCTYNGERITPAIFEKEENRADFYEIMIACILKNIRPFFKSLTSVLSNRGLKMN